VQVWRSPLIIWVVVGDSERIEMGKRGREKMFREFDESIVIGKYLDSLEMVLKK